MSSFRQAIFWWGEGDPMRRGTVPALGLVVVLVWMMNSLCNRPGDRWGERRLARSVLPVEYVQVQGQESELDPIVEGVPANPYRLFFVADIKADARSVPVPRLSAHLDVDERVLQDIVGADQWSEIKVLLVPRLEKIQRDPKRVMNKGMSRAIRKVREEEVVTSVSEEGTYRSNEDNFDQGSDLDPSEMVYRPLADASSLNMRLTSIWFQMLADVLGKIPNQGTRSDAPSFSVLRVAQRVSRKKNWFQEKNLAKIFVVVRVWRTSAASWQRMFELVFPTKKWLEPTSSQNWSQIQWLPQWYELQARLAPEAFRDCRDELRVKWNELSWFPKLTKERIWFTKKEIGDNVVRPKTHKAAAPSIAMNPLRPEWTFNLEAARAANNCEESEDESGTESGESMAEGEY
jgi:hypothetical protein